MAGAIEFVQETQVRPFLVGFFELEVGIEITIGLLGGRDAVDHAIQAFLPLGIGVGRQRIGGCFDPLVDIGIIEGDIQSSQDAERIAKKGVPAVQINTGGECHLDGNMIRDAFKEFDFEKMDLLIVENVGNLVCPAEFKVGEDFKAMILSVTEGDDKPPKYPLMFRESKVLLINKIDLLPYVDCSLDRIKEDSLKINPDLSIFQVSCKTGEGLEEWYEWLREKVKNREVIS